MYRYQRDSLIEAGRRRAGALRVMAAVNGERNNRKTRVAAVCPREWRYLMKASN